ncbi:MAG: hypothetical protein ACKO40_06180 [Planctomycetaceae bacterium]
MHAPELVPVVAAGIDWLESLLPLLFVLFWIVSQVVTLIRRVAGDGGRPGPAPVVLPRPPRPADDAREVLERQIGEFLRESRGDRGRAAAAKPVAPRPEPRRPKPPKPVQRQATPVAASRVPPPLPAPPPRLSDRHLQPLGEAGDDITQHVDGAFAHDLRHRVAPSSTAVTATGSAAARGTTAADLAAALRDPATLRRLVLVREVLERPVDRWE